MLTLGAIASASFLSVGANDDAALKEITVPRDISDDVPIGLSAQQMPCQQAEAKTMLRY